MFSTRKVRQSAGVCPCVIMNIAICVLADPLRLAGSREQAYLSLCVWEWANLMPSTVRRLKCLQPSQLVVECALSRSLSEFFALYCSIRIVHCFKLIVIHIILVFKLSNLIIKFFTHVHVYIILQCVCVCFIIVFTK